jgi:hypothetical protein
MLFSEAFVNPQSQKSVSLFYIPLTYYTLTNNTFTVPCSGAHFTYLCTKFVVYITLMSGAN